MEVLQAVLVVLAPSLANFSLVWLCATPSAALSSPPPDPAEDSRNRTAIIVSQFQWHADTCRGSILFPFSGSP